MKHQFLMPSKDKSKKKTILIMNKVSSAAIFVCRFMGCLVLNVKNPINSINKGRYALLFIVFGFAFFS